MRALSKLCSGWRSNGSRLEHQPGHGPSHANNDERRRGPGSRTIGHLVAWIGIATLALGACNQPTDNLKDGTPLALGNGNATTGSGDSTYDHANDSVGSDLSPVDPAEVRAASSPEVTSRLHSCGKMTVASLGRLLESRGLGGGGARPDGIPSAQDILGNPETAAALGAPNYDGRVPEAAFGSTSAVAKAFDIYMLASYDAVDPTFNAPACPGVKVLGDDGKFTKDGVSCLIGKPATSEHVAIANDAIVQNPTDGAKIAIAAMLAAAHTCQ